MELYYCGNQWGYTPLGNTSNIPGGYCNVPLYLSAVVNNQWVTFSWTAPHDYEAFHLEYSTDGDIWEQIIVRGVNYTIALAPNTSYSWRVRTVCDSLNTRYSSYANGSTVDTGPLLSSCDPVSAVTVTNMGISYRISWDDTGAMYYKVYICPNESNCSIYYTTKLDYYDTVGLLAGIKYRVKVVAVCSDGKESIASPWFSFTSSNVNCHSPINLKTVVSSVSIIASWYPNPLSSFLQTYNIYLDGFLVAKNYPTTNFAFTNLTPDTEYTIEIRANCNGGFSIPLIAVIATLLDPCSCDITLALDTVTNTTATIDIGVSCTGASTLDHFELIVNSSEVLELPSNTVSYTITDITPGLLTKVKLRGVCDNGAFTDYRLLDIILTNCGIITGLQITKAYGNMTVLWDSISNAVKYEIEIYKDDVLQDTVYSDIAVYILLNVIRGAEYKFKIWPVCYIDGSDITGTYGEITDTYAQDSCATYDIQMIWKSATTAYAVVSLDNGTVYNGPSRLVVYDDTDALIFNQRITGPGKYEITGLVNGDDYTISAYVIANGNTGDEPPEDGCNIVFGNYTHSNCWVPPAGNVVLTQPTPTSLLVTINTPDWQPTQDAVILKWAYEGDVYSDPIDVVVGDFPYTIAVPGYARYKVIIDPKCNGVQLGEVEYKYSCPDIASAEITVEGNTLSGTITPTLLGVYKYKITLTALGQSSITEFTTNSVFTISGLALGFIYSGVIELICNDDPETLSDPYEFMFRTNITSATVECPEPVFITTSQDCDTIIPPPDCTVQERDWSIVSTFIIPLSSDPANSLFFEGTFRLYNAVPEFQAALVPGGILGVIIGSQCAPLAVTEAILEIVTGGYNLLSGAATIDTSGTITASGAYTSNGSTELIVRVRASYQKSI